MNITASDLKQYVIQPTLEYLGMYSSAAEKLLLGTAAQESGFDPFCQTDPDSRKNCPDGLGIYQISSEEHRRIWDNYLAFRPDLASLVRGLASQHLFLQAPDQELRNNLAYSTAIAWIIYLESEDPLPAADDADGLGHYWQSHFAHSHYQRQNTQDFAQWIRRYSPAA